MTTHKSGLIPVATIALECRADIDTLIKRFGSAVCTDSAGLRAAPEEVCLAFLGGRKAAQQAERERRAPELERAKANDPVKALRKRLRARRPATGTAPALAHALASEHENRPLDEMLAPAGSALIYHPLNRKAADR